MWWASWQLNDMILWSNGYQCEMQIPRLGSNSQRQRQITDVDLGQVGKFKLQSINGGHLLD